jgi:hypothetical protein
MIRFILAVYLLGALAIHLLFLGDVSLKMDVAPQINAGNELLVQVSLTKKDISGFCRFQQELPAGFTAVSVSASNADFSFKDQKVRFIWLKLPDDETVTISYKIKCDERLKGSFNLSGKFSYIDDNQRKSVELDQKLLTIIPSPNINPALLVDVNDFGKNMNFAVAETSFGKVACVRQKPVWSPDQKEFVINLLVNKEKLQKFAKIEEFVPKGYTALNVNSRDGIFTFKDGKAKFIWMNLPSDPYFVVSYKLVPTNGVSEEGINLKGTFSYIIDDKTQSIDIFEKEANLISIKPEEVALLLKPEPKPQPIPKPVQPQPKQPVVAVVTPPVVKTPPPITTPPIVPPVVTPPVAVVPVVTSPVVTTPDKTDKKVVVADNPSKPPVVVTTPVNNKVVPAIQPKPATPPVAVNTKKPDTVPVMNIVKEPVVVADQVPVTHDNEILKPGSTGIYYRVQIAAGHKPVNIRSYFRKFKLEKSVSKEDHQGWIKYSVGSFDAYKDAHDYRVHLWNTTPIADAFVSAYNEGTRITVQEALMVTNQKWIK